MEAADGRGPFRPGWSHIWRDADGHDFAPPWVEAGLALNAFLALIPAGSSACCACRSRDELRAWFSRSERRRLKRFGYEEVAVEAYAILLETPTQVVFARAHHNPASARPHDEARCAAGFVARSFHEADNA